MVRIHRTRFLSSGQTGYDLSDHLWVDCGLLVIWDANDSRLMLTGVPVAWLRYGKVLLPKRRPRRVKPEAWRQIRQWFNNHTGANPSSARP